MRKFAVSISVKDNESPFRNVLTIDQMELTQENVSLAVDEVSSIKNVFENLTDEDTVTASVDITDDQDTTRNASVSVSNVKRKEFDEVGAMLNAAFAALNPPAPATPVIPLTEGTSEGDQAEQK